MGQFKPSFLTKGKFRGVNALIVTLALSASVAIAPAYAEKTPSSAQLTSNSLAGNYLAARIATTDKDTQSAVAFFRKTLAQDPDNIDLKLKAFLTFVANGDFSEGVTIADDLVKAGQAPEIVSIILSVDHIRSKSWARADKELDKQWRSTLDRLVAGLVQSWSRLGEGQVKKALRTVDDLKGPNWFDPFVQYHGGLIALLGNDTEEAVRRLKDAYDRGLVPGQMQPATHSRVIQALANAYWKNGQKEEAVKLIEQTLERRPQDPIFVSMLESAKADKQPAFDIASAPRGAAEVFMNIGKAIDRDGGQQFARIYMQLASTLAPKNDLVKAELAQIYDKQSQIAQANVLFSSISEASPLYRIARLELALNLDELGKQEEARVELDKLISENPDDLVTHLSYGAVLARHKKFDDASKIYNKIIARIDKPERVHWNLFYRLGISYERTKQWPKAEKAFRKALELFPDQPSVLNYLGYSWIDRNENLQEGLDMIRKAVSIRPNDGYIVDSLGWAYYRLNRFEEAVVELEKAVSLRPGDPTINDHLGDAYWRAKRRLEATFQWNHALALDPPAADIARIEEKLSKGLDAVLEREAQEAAEAKKKKTENDG